MNHMLAIGGRPRTAEAFLTWPGDGRARRYELVDGEVRAMSPGSVIHGIIQLTLGSMIRQHLRASGSACTVLTEPAVQPRLRARHNIRVPDIGVTCAPITADQVVMEAPVLLVEVLSPSNRARIWSNVWAYTTIPSLREILVVQSRRVEVQVLRASPERVWPDNPEIVAAGATLRLDSIDFKCPVEALYEGTPLA